MKTRQFVIDNLKAVKAEAPYLRTQMTHTQRRFLDAIERFPAYDGYNPIAEHLGVTTTAVSAHMMNFLRMLDVKSTEVPTPAEKPLRVDIPRGLGIITLDVHNIMGVDMVRLSDHQAEVDRIHAQYADLKAAIELISETIKEVRI